jgi:hypothetical protein
VSSAVTFAARQTLAELFSFSSRSFCLCPLALHKQTPNPAIALYRNGKIAGYIFSPLDINEWLGSDANGSFAAI